MNQRLPGLSAAATLLSVSILCCSGCRQTGSAGSAAAGSPVSTPQLQTAALRYGEQSVGAEPCNDTPRHFVWEDPDLDGDGYGDSYTYSGPPGLPGRSGHTIFLPNSGISLWSEDSYFYADEGLESCDLLPIRRNEDGTTEYAWEYKYDWLDLPEGSSSMPITVIFCSGDFWEGGNIIALQDAILLPGKPGLSGQVTLPSGMGEDCAALTRESDSITTLRLLTGRIPEYSLQATRREYDYDGESEIYHHYTHYSMPYDSSVLRKELSKLRPGRYRFEFELGNVEPTSYTVTLYDSRGWAVGQKSQELPNSFSRMRGQVETVGEAYYMRVSHNYEPGG